MLIRHCISIGLPLGIKVWKGLSFSVLLTAPVSIKIQGSFVTKSLWKAWELVKPWLAWLGNGQKKGASISSINVWWSSVINWQGQPLVTLPWIHAQRFYKKRIASIADFFSPPTRDWILWEELQQLF